MRSTICLELISLLHGIPRLTDLVLEHGFGAVEVPIALFTAMNHFLIGRLQMSLFTLRNKFATTT